MTTYPTPSDIEVQWRKSGSGVCVVVEGETEMEDAWYYSRWFASRAREVTFFPQDGWQKVVEAVAALRNTLGDASVFGIIDRDFEDHVAYISVPPDGVLRTPRATLENYLLEPACWFRYVQPLTLKTSKSGWGSVEEVHAAILGFYKECMPLAAVNWTLRRARLLNPTAFQALRRSDQEYKGHPMAIANLGDVPAYPRGLQSYATLNVDLGQMYQDRVAAMADMPLADLEQVVSGKYVLRLLKERFPLGTLKPQAWDDILGAYMFICPDPPADLVQLVDLILAQPE